MTSVGCVVLDPTTITVRLPGTPVSTLPWSPTEPDALRALVPRLTGRVQQLVVVVGLGLSEWAKPALPPVPAATRRAIVWLDPARYLAVEETMAVTCLDAWVVGVPAARLAAWRQALAPIAPVTVLSAAAVAVHLGGSQRLRLPAGDGDPVELVLRDGQLEQLHRASGLAMPAPAGAGPGTSWDSGRIADVAAAWVRPAPSAWLLDPTEGAALARTTQRRWWQRLALAGATAVLALLGAERWHVAQVTRAVDEAQKQAAAARPAWDAYRRLAAARTEAKVVQDDANRSMARTAPLAMLAALTRRLPSDVVVQRLEWDGTTWRIEGTAERAPRLIPLLDADPMFRGIRMTAPVQRFLDAGRQRDAFTFAWPGAPSAEGRQHDE